MTLCFLLKNKIRFNTLSGPGSEVIYNAKDNLWQTDALNAGLKFYYVYKLRHDKNLSVLQKIKWLNEGIKVIKRNYPTKSI